MGDIAGTAATRRIPGYARKKDFLRRQRNSATLCGKDREERIVVGMYSLYMYVHATRHFYSECGYFLSQDFYFSSFRRSGAAHTV